MTNLSRYTDIIIVIIDLILGVGASIGVGVEIVAHGQATDRMLLYIILLTVTSINTRIRSRL